MTTGAVSGRSRVGKTFRRSSSDAALGSGVSSAQPESSATLRASAKSRAALAGGGVRRARLRFRTARRAAGCMGPKSISRRRAPADALGGGFGFGDDREPALQHFDAGAGPVHALGEMPAPEPAAGLAVEERDQRLRQRAERNAFAQHTLDERKIGADDLGARGRGADIAEDAAVDFGQHVGRLVSGAADHDSVEFSGPD